MRTLITTIGGIVALCSSAAAVPFEVLSWDLGAVEPGALGFNGENVTVSSGRFFRSSITASSDRGPTQGTVNPNRIYDSYAAFDGGALQTTDTNGDHHGPFSGPTVSESATDLGDGYDTNTGFASVIPIGFTRAHFNAEGTAFGGGVFEVLPRSSTRAVGVEVGAPQVHSFFIGRVTVPRSAWLLGGRIQLLIASEGAENDGGVLVGLEFHGAWVSVGKSNNTDAPVALENSYAFVSTLVARPDGLGAQQTPGVGAFGDGDTYDLHVIAVPGVPGVGCLGIAAGLGMMARRRRRFFS